MWSDGGMVIQREVMVVSNFLVPDGNKMPGGRAKEPENKLQQSRKNKVTAKIAAKVIRKRNPQN